MNTIFRNISYVLCVGLFVLPAVASAHATPIDYSPRSSATVDTVPTSVHIRFSEHIDAHASSIRIKGPSGAEVATSEAHTNATDTQELVVPVRDDGVGTYLVSWSVVSADDGHFTKGAYPFAVGKGIVASDAGAVDAEVVQIATKPEALSMTVELMGNGFILAALLLFAIAFRPLLRRSSFAGEQRPIARGYAFFLWGGVLLALVGGALQLLLKAKELAILKQVDLLAAIPIYLTTTAGSATLYRMMAVFVVGITFYVGRRRIISAAGITVYELLIGIAMAFFEYFRAVVSHATANPFHPHFSVAINFVHLIEKDLWAGVLGIVLVLSLSRSLREILYAVIPRVFTILSVNLAAVAVTACYIVWLHLKSFENLLSTTWGHACISLLVVALIVAALRIYHVCARVKWPSLFVRFVPMTLAVECAAALLVVYFSSAIIITSPPLLQPDTHVFSATNQGVKVQLQRDQIEDGMLLLTAVGGSAIQEPTVTLKNETETISVSLQKRFEGGYVFPLALLAGDVSNTLHVQVPQTKGYDADVLFTASQHDFTPQVGWERHRSFDTFAIALTIIAILGLLLAYALLRFSRYEVSLPAHRWKFAAPLAVPFFLIAALVLGNGAAAVAASPIANPFKSVCEADGNMWHLMQPTRAGEALSQTAREGCMWGMGSFTYLFADKREYDYASSFPAARVTLATVPAKPVAGIRTTFAVSLKNEDGTPATLYVDMEKLLHVVVLSEDQTVFAHIHPDDEHPLTEKEKETSTFTLAYTFPKAGKYLIAADYAHGLTLESKQFIVDVAGAPAQAKEPATYKAEGTFGGYQVSLNSGVSLAGEVTTLQFKVMKDGKPVENLEPYLSAAMHISVVKNDLSTFIHTHGEVHAPGTPYPPIIIKNGNVLHSMASMVTPIHFGPNIEAHLIFPQPGFYTVWAQFKVDGAVIPSRFTVQVE